MKNIKFKGADCYVAISEYNSGKTRISIFNIVSDELVCTPTINGDSAEAFDLDENEVLIINYFDGEDVLTLLEDAGVVERTGREVEVDAVSYQICTI